MATPLQFGDLFSEAATGFVITDIHGGVVHANGAFARMLGREPEHVLHANLFAWTHPEDRPRYDALLQQLLKAEIPGFIIEKRYLKPDGSSVWVRNSVSLMGADHEHAGQLFSICEDINDRKHAESVLERQEQMASIGKLTSSIIHEINNPLEAVTNLLYLAQHTAHADEASAYLRQAEEELRRASEITSQGLQFHRQSASPIPMNVADLVQSVLMLFKGRLKEARVEVEFTKSVVPELTCFAGEMRQVFVNLIANAIEAMPRGGRLRIRVRRGTDWRTGDSGVRVTISDNGIGISAETRKRMYDAFVTTKGAQGSGLGLWVSSNIVRKHRGRIRVRSKCDGPSTGTTFSAVFPYHGALGQTPGFQANAA
jgi:PAS domain S-box-containing protein